MAQTSNVTLPQDKGPDKIDVSAYPRGPAEGLQAVYRQVLQVPHHRAAHQHHDDSAEWERYVKRMMHKPNSGISDSQGKTIFEFLVYDQTNRKDKNPKAFFPALSDEEIEKLKASSSSTG